MKNKIKELAAEIKAFYKGDSPIAKKIGYSAAVIIIVVITIAIIVGLS